MYLIMGGTGHIGSYLTKILLGYGHKVGVLTRRMDNATKQVQQGAKAIVLDIHNQQALHEAFCQAKRIYILNPQACPQLDVEKVERDTISTIISALNQTKLDRVVVQSTYGAQSGSAIGDLGSLYELEKKVQEIYPEAVILRAAFFMSNWKANWNEIRQNGEMTSVYPYDHKMPMVAPQDIADCAAKVLMDDNVVKKKIYIEGPRRYLIRDVVDAFSLICRQNIHYKLIEGNMIEAYYRGLGFSHASAHSYARMAHKNNNGEIELPVRYLKGSTSLIDYLQQMIAEK